MIVRHYIAARGRPAAAGRRVFFGNSREKLSTRSAARALDGNEPDNGGGPPFAKRGTEELPMTAHQILSLGSRAVTVASVLCLVVAAPAAFQEPAKKVVPAVAPAALEGLLPALDGWTKGRVISNRILSADSCTYVYADAIYTSRDAKLRVTLADTGFDADGLMALATIVQTFPADHSEVVPPDTRINRLTYRGEPAATLWNGAKRDGDFTVVVAGRFVAKVEGTPADSLDVLRAAMDQIDFKKLADLGR
jgi:hypothetical protein